MKGPGSRTTQLRQGVCACMGMSRCCLAPACECSCDVGEQVKALPFFSASPAPPWPSLPLRFNPKLLAFDLPHQPCPAPPCPPKPPQAAAKMSALARIGPALSHAPLISVTAYHHIAVAVTDAAASSVFFSKIGFEAIGDRLLRNTGGLGLHLLQV